LGKEERLKSRLLIERVFREGRSFFLSPYRVHYLFLPPGGKGAAGENKSYSPVQAGFGASSRQFKRAVDRNRIKRLSREAYRLQKQPLKECLEQKGGALALFFIYTAKEIADQRTVSEKIRLALQKLMKEAAG
jgi:ribonuclease P protein component